MAVQEQRELTIDAFWEMAQQPEYEDKQLELFEGVLFVMRPSSSQNSKIAMTIGRLIGNFIAEHDLGMVTGTDGSYQSDDVTVLVPDVAFIQNARIPEGDYTFYRVPPDLTVEVISSIETGRKTRKYFLQSGVQVVWQVYLDDQTVDVVPVNADGDPITKTVPADGQIDGGDVISGFRTKISKFFE